jgi:hypothetical protein
MVPPLPSAHWARLGVFCLTALPMLQVAVVSLGSQCHQFLPLQ